LSGLNDRRSLVRIAVISIFTAKYTPLEVLVTFVLVLFIPSHTLTALLLSLCSFLSPIYTLSFFVVDSFLYLSFSAIVQLAKIHMKLSGLLSLSQPDSEDAT